MSTFSEELDMIPECNCGRGKMKLFCAGKEATHAGRYYYKCPLNAKHSRSFLWCDEYHSRNGDAKQPSYVLNQLYRPMKPVYSSDAVKNKKMNQAGSVCGVCGCCRAETRMNLLLVFMGLVLLILGIVLGRLF